MKKQFFCGMCEKITKHKLKTVRKKEGKFFARKCLECKKQQEGVLFGDFFLANYQSVNENTEKATKS